MKSALSLGIAVFVLGAALGAIGLKVWLDRHPVEPVTQGASVIDRSVQSVRIDEQGLLLSIRKTDSLARIKGEGDQIIGARIFDTWSGDQNTASSSIDLIWERQEKFFDQPDVKNLDGYRKPTTQGLTIQETKELMIDGRPALKQLYTMQLEVPGPFGSTSKQPVPNQLRYVIADGERFLILRAPGSQQTFLDAMAQSLTFTNKSATPSPAVDSISVDGSGEASGTAIDGELPVATDGNTIDLQAQ